MSLQDEPFLVRDFINIVEQDKWAWVPVWGDARCGKTSLALVIMFKIYKDWDSVLNAIVFNLNQLLYKIKKGEPKLFPTLTKPCHMRIPVLLYDDFAASSGKARTQHERVWDIAKGAWDTLGTRIAILLASMVDPGSPTQQLMLKYSHEIKVEFAPNGKRIYKYDRVKRQQDFRGWSARQDKTWLETQEFEPVPLDVFQQYDEMRQSLVDEVLVSMQDTMSDETLDGLVRKVESIDLTMLGLIKERGPVQYNYVKESLGEEGKRAVTRCKARGLIVPVRLGPTYYKYDLTELGLDLLLKIQQGKTEKSKSAIDRIDS